MEIKNARITKTMLGREDHGIMTFSVFIHTDMYDCGVGGYAIDQYNRESQSRVFTAKRLRSYF